jgi:transposase
MPTGSRAGSSRPAQPIYLICTPSPRGLERDSNAVIAALTLPYGNRPTEGVNTKTKRIARQMHGQAGFTLLRHRILLG